MIYAAETCLDTAKGHTVGEIFYRVAPIQFGKLILASTIFLGLSGVVVGGATGNLVTHEAVPERKQTDSSYYLTSEIAHDLLVGDPSILFVEVRSVEEVQETGHPQQVDAIVPFKVQSEVWNAELGEPELVVNPKFVETIHTLLKSSGRSKFDMVIITCGSGVRSAAAARTLEENGFTYVWHIPDGYVGDDKPGLNSRNAWKDKGLPWSETITATVF